MQQTKVKHIGKRQRETAYKRRRKQKEKETENVKKTTNINQRQKK